MKIARRIPKASSRSFRTGARQCTVEDALETMRWAGESAASLTPRTIVTSGGSSGGASRMTRRAPAARCASTSARVRPREVASSTVSTPSSPQAGPGGWSFPGEQRDPAARRRRGSRPSPRPPRGSGRAACRSAAGTRRRPARRDRRPLRCGCPRARRAGGRDSARSGRSRRCRPSSCRSVYHTAGGEIRRGEWRRLGQVPEFCILRGESSLVRRLTELALSCSLSQSWRRARRREAARPRPRRAVRRHARAAQRDHGRQGRDGRPQHDHPRRGRAQGRPGPRAHGRDRRRAARPGDARRPRLRRLVRAERRGRDDRDDVGRGVRASSRGPS